MMNPSRSASKGRLARCGSSFRVESAFMALNPPTPVTQMHDSVPPAIMASASPRWIHLKASPMEWVPVAQAVTTLMFGPLAPKRMEIIPRRLR